MKRWKKKERLEKSGLRHVAGWVDKDDKPAVDEMIERQKDKVEAIKENCDE